MGTAFGKGMFEAEVGPSNIRGEGVAVGRGCGVLGTVEATWDVVVGSSPVCQQAVATVDNINSVQTIRVKICLLHLRL